MTAKALRQSVTRVHKAFGSNIPELALVLGSGFQDVISTFKVKSRLDFSLLPGFPDLRVKGHLGELLLCEADGLPLLVCSGRAHYYEGHLMEAVMFPILVLAECGVTELVLTNAAGGINRRYKPGHFMLFSDHINYLGANPLRGLPVEDGKCFVDLSDTYCQSLRGQFQAAARKERIVLHEGVYVGVSGPSYETPAEIRAFREWGADAVGMSTIPEVLMARYRGIRVAAISCITNHAAGIRPGKLSHKDVLETGRENSINAGRLLHRFARVHSEAKNR